MMAVGHHLRPTAAISRAPCLRSSFAVTSLFLRCDFAFFTYAKQTNSLSHPILEDSLSFSHPILEGNDLFSHPILEDS